MVKKKSLADNIAALLDPTPKSYDPEADDVFDGAGDREDDELYSEDEDPTIFTERSQLRAKASTAADLGSKYMGKKVTRAGLDSDEDEEDDAFVDMDGGSEDEDGSADEDEEDDFSGGRASGDDDDDDDDEYDSEMSDDGGRGEGDVDEDLQLELRRIEEEEKKSLSNLRESNKAELEKALHVKNQRAVWDSTLDLRISMQNALPCANRLPEPEMIVAFAEHNEAVRLALQETTASVQSLLDDLLDLGNSLVAQNEDIDVAEPKPAKKGKKRALEDTWNSVDAHTHGLDAFQEATIDKWNRRTQLASGSMMSKKFKAVNQGVLTQITQIMSDTPRLVKRTRANRLGVKIIGASAPATKAGSENTEINEEIFDDTDFYEYLLREIIESGPASSEDGALQLNREWMKKQHKLARSRKNVDRRASKGRKIRYTTHEKLVNFMFPTGLGAEQYVTEELFKSLFGGNGAMAGR